MAFLSVGELIDIVIMTVFVGFIFGDVFSSARRIAVDTEGRELPNTSSRSWNWDNFKFAVIVTAPAIIFHEFGHKIVAMLFGMKATFSAAYGWLALGLGLKLLSFPFIFFVPAYVSIIGSTTPLNYSLIAFAGPAVNMVMWLVAGIMIKSGKYSRKTTIILQLTKQINMFLFIFNMIPIPGFDGSKVFSGLLGAF